MSSQYHLTLSERVAGYCNNMLALADSTGVEFSFTGLSPKLLHLVFVEPHHLVPMSMADSSLDVINAYDVCYQINTNSVNVTEDYVLNPMYFSFEDNVFCDMLTDLSKIDGKGGQHSNWYTHALNKNIAIVTLKLRKNLINDDLFYWKYFYKIVEEVLITNTFREIILCCPFSIPFVMYKSIEEDTFIKSVELFNSVLPIFESAYCVVHEKLITFWEKNIKPYYVDQLIVMKYYNTCIKLKTTLHDLLGTIVMQTINNPNWLRECGFTRLLDRLTTRKIYAILLYDVDSEYGLKGAAKDHFVRLLRLFRKRRYHTAAEQFDTISSILKIYAMYKYMVNKIREYHLTILYSPVNDSNSSNETLCMMQKSLYFDIIRLHDRFLQVIRHFVMMHVQKNDASTTDVTQDESAPTIDVTQDESDILILYHKYYSDTEDVSFNFSTSAITIPKNSYYPSVDSNNIILNDNEDECTNTGHNNRECTKQRENRSINMKDKIRKKLNFSSVSPSISSDISTTGSSNNDADEDDSTDFDRLYTLLFENRIDGGRDVHLLENVFLLEDSVFQPIVTRSNVSTSRRRQIAVVSPRRMVNEVVRNINQEGMLHSGQNNGDRSAEELTEEMEMTTVYPVSQIKNKFISYHDFKEMSCDMLIAILSVFNRNQIYYEMSPDHFFWEVERLYPIVMENSTSPIISQIKHHILYGRLKNDK